MINFEALRKARERVDDSRDGQFGRCGNWKIALGGYDMGYEVYYKNYPVMRVNYELDEYEFYSCDYSDVMFTQDTIPQIKKALEITPRFDNVGDIDDSGDDIDRFGQYVNGVEANVSEGNKMKFKKIVKEAKLPVMWAIDYRDFHTAIHGLIYGKNRRDVEEFYDRLKAIYSDRDISPEEQEMLYQDLWDEFYPEINQIDEINFRDIGKLPSGKYGIVLDDVEYRLVNNVAIDIYEESKKIVKESSNVAKFRASIEAAKNRIIRKVERNGVVENLGQDEVRKLKDTLDDMVFSGACEKSDELQMSRMLDNFDDWASTYNGKIVKEVDEKPNPDFKPLDKAMWEIGKTPNGKRQNESDEGGTDHPRIYVGTYAKYNNGSIDGKWIDISEYNTYEEFVDACRELHSDEDDPEFMVQDYENFPRKWYHEGGLPSEEEFNKINEYYMMDDTEQRAYEAYVNYTDDDDIDNFHEAYEGQFDSASDFAYDLVDSIGWDGIGSDTLDMYFDYDAFGRDLMFDFHMGDEDNKDAEGNPEDPDHYYDNEGYDMGEYESDDQVARDFIDGLGGVNQLGPDTARNYFDYDAFGRDLLMSDYFEEDGFVFRHI